MPRLLKSIFLISFLLFFCSTFVFAEDITITSYYPSPYGSYRELRTVKQGIGTTYSNRASVCWDPPCPVGSTDVSAANPDLLVEGNVGIGTTSPQGPLHVLGTTATPSPSILIEQRSTTGRGSPRLGLVDTLLGPVTTAPAWFVDNYNDLFRIFRQSNIIALGVAYLTINNTGGIATGSYAARTYVPGPDYLVVPSDALIVSGNVGIGTTNPLGKLDVNGAIFQRGISLHADYVFELAYKLESIEDHSAYMWQNKHLKAVPVATKDEKGQDIVNWGERNRGVLEELEKAHVYIQQLNERIKALEMKPKDAEVK